MKFIRKNGPIVINYGSREKDGVYLRVKDERLKVTLNSQGPSSTEVDVLAVALYSSDGTYLNIRTGEGSESTRSESKKVSVEAMRIYLERFGAENGHITELLDNETAFKDDDVVDAVAVPVAAEAQREKADVAVAETLQQNDVAASVTASPVKKQKPQLCAACCALSAQFRCGKCKSINYCSQDCQKTNWATHKLFCQAWPFPEKPPGRKCIDVVYLPVDGDLPRFMTVFFMETKVDGEPFFVPVVNEILGLRHGSEQGRSIMRQNRKREEKGAPPMKEMFEFAYRDNFLNDGSKPNKCVNNLTRGKAPHGWKGPVVVMKFRLLHGYCEDYLDMTMEDTPQLVDFLLDYGRTQQAPPDWMKEYNFNVMNL